MRSCTTPRNRTTTTRCTTRTHSCTPTSSARSRCSRRSASTTSDFTTSPPTRSTATWSSTIRSGSPSPVPYNPSSPYSSTKAGSDLLVRAWVRSFGVAATISNCSNNYGPYQHVEKFIPRQITNILRGIRPKLYGDGRERARLDPRRRPLLGGAARSSTKAGSARPTSSAPTARRTTREVVELILTMMGQDRDAYDHVTDRTGHDLRYAIDSTKLRNELGWDAKRTSTSRQAWPRPSSGIATNEDWWAPAKGRRRSVLRPTRAMTETPDNTARSSRAKDTPIPGLTVLGAARPRRQPRLVQRELAAREDGGRRDARLRSSATEHLVQRRSSAPRAVSTPNPGTSSSRSRPDGSSARGSTCARARHSGPCSPPNSTHRARSSCLAASANAYQTLEPDTVYTYLVNDHYSPDAVYTSVHPADETVAIDWPIPLEHAEMSAKDRAQPRLADVIPIPPRKTLGPRR